MKLRRAQQRRRREPRRANVTRELVERRAVEVARRAFAYVDETEVIGRTSLVDLGRLAAGWAAALRKQGVEPGDRIVVLADEGLAWVGAVFGVLKIGAIAVPCPPSLLPGDLAAVVRVSDARVIVASGAAKKIVATTEAAPPALWLEEVEPLDRPLAGAVETFETYTDDVALLLPVRGPNGGAVLAAHTHDSTLRCASRGRHWLASGRRDRLWCTAEPGSPEFLMTVFGAWAQGTEVVLHEPIAEAARRLELIELLRVTVLVQSAAEYRLLAAYRGRTAYDLSGLREAVCLGDPVPAAAHAAFRDRFDIWIRSCYGRPESGVVSADPREPTAHAGSVGVPLPGSRVGVIDDAGDEVEPGDAGDLAVRDGAPGLFAGYWDDRDATEGAFRGVWFLTGDLAVREVDDVVRLAWPAEVRALDDRRRAAGEERERRQAEELQRQQELEAEEARRREEEDAARQEERARREEQRKQRAAERSRRDRERALERKRLEEEKRQVVELESGATRRRQADEAARREQLREQRLAEKAARDRARAEERALTEARTREEQEQKRQRSAKPTRTGTPDQEQQRQGKAAAADEAERRRAAEERKRQQNLEREQARARANEAKREQEEARKAEEAERRHAAEERKRQEALQREQTRAQAEQRKREQEEARKAEEAERRHAAEERKRQQEIEREQERLAAEAKRREAAEQQQAAAAERRRAEEEAKRQQALERERERAQARKGPPKPARKRAPRPAKDDESTGANVVSRIGAYGISPKDRRRPPDDTEPDRAA